MTSKAPSKSPPEGGEFGTVYRTRKKENMKEGSFTIRTGIAGGTLTVLLSISTADMMRTIVLAAIGATVSFGVSLLLKKLVRWWKPPKSP